MSPLGNEVVFITGAARGIGAGTARALARRGARLILVDLDAAPLQELAAEIGEELVVSVPCDVCDLDALKDAATAGIERFGGIDLVLANAGVASYGSVAAVDPEMFKRVLDVNLLGVFHTVRATLAAVVERRGYYLIVSSEAAFAPGAGVASYCASKAGVEHFASSLRLELAHQGVEVGSAHMSWIDTPLVRDAKSDLTSFREMLSALPGPLGKTLPLERCVEAFVEGLEQRKRRVYVPRWVGLLSWLKPLLTSRPGEQQSLKKVPHLLGMMDDEVERLGRSTSASNVAMSDVSSTG